MNIFIIPDIKNYFIVQATFMPDGQPPGKMQDNPYLNQQKNPGRYLDMAYYSPGRCDHGQNNNRINKKFPQICMTSKIDKPVKIDDIAHIQKKQGIGTCKYIYTGYF